MKLIISGGRYIELTAPLPGYVRLFYPEAREIVHGGCPTGIDKMASVPLTQTPGMYARSNPPQVLPIKCFPPDWETHGKAAGPIRNAEMANYADALLLIWDGKSRGSASMLKCAQKEGLEIVQVIL